MKPTYHVMQVVGFAGVIGSGKSVIFSAATPIVHHTSTKFMLVEG
jgi:ABC-type dipeptide/oligopeptide/nickel transport system ATPase component